MRMAHIQAIASAVLLLAGSLTAAADTFGTGDNQFEIEFVTISGDTNPTSGYGIVNDDYRIGKFEITNSQWDKFEASLSVPVTGAPYDAYLENSLHSGVDIPVTGVSWFEAAQFVNWLNTSTGHQAAYKFTGTQGTSDYALEHWSPAEANNGTNLFRHRDALYFLASEDEWVKACAWNGTALQTFGTKTGEFPQQGDGVSGTGWNYHDHWNTTSNLGAPWAVGSGSEELNGTHDMIGNVWEWTEGTLYDDYGVLSRRVSHCGAYHDRYDINALDITYRANFHPADEFADIGFRVASVPEPSSLMLLSCGVLALTRRRSR